MASRDQGLWLEFGAASGSSTKRIARHHHVHSFDSFEGLPEQWREPPEGGHKNLTKMASDWLSKGSFNRSGIPPHLRRAESRNITWAIGWFDRTLPPFLARHADRNVSFVSIDCDIYSSASTVLRLLAPRLSPGAILVFDELINYPEFEAGEMKALLELQRDTGRSLRVLGTPSRRVALTEAAARAVIRRFGTVYGEQSNRSEHGFLQQALVQIV